MCYHFLVEASEEIHTYIHVQAHAYMSTCAYHFLENRSAREHTIHVCDEVTNLRYVCVFTCIYACIMCVYKFNLTCHIVLASAFTTYVRMYVYVHVCMYILIGMYVYICACMYICTNSLNMQPRDIKGSTHHSITSTKQNSTYIHTPPLLFPANHRSTYTHKHTHPSVISRQCLKVVN
jgi:hypothetical protein